MTFSFFLLFFGGVWGVLLMIWELNPAPSSVSLSFAWRGTDLGCRGRRAQTMRSEGGASITGHTGHGHQSTSRACFLISILGRRKERWDFTMTWKASPQSPLNGEEIVQAKNCFTLWIGECWGQVKSLHTWRHHDPPGILEDSSKSQICRALFLELHLPCSFSVLLGQKVS